MMRHVVKEIRERWTGFDWSIRGSALMGLQAIKDISTLLALLDEKDSKTEPEKDPPITNLPRELVDLLAILDWIPTSVVWNYLGTRNCRRPEYAARVQYLVSELGFLMKMRLSVVVDEGGIRSEPKQMICWTRKSFVGLGTRVVWENGGFRVPDLGEISKDSIE